MSITYIDILISSSQSQAMFQDRDGKPYIKGIFVKIVFQKPEKQLFGKCYLNLHLFK